MRARWSLGIGIALGVVGVCGCDATSIPARQGTVSDALRFEQQDTPDYRLESQHWTGADDRQVFDQYRDAPHAN